MNHEQHHDNAPYTWGTFADDPDKLFHTEALGLFRAEMIGLLLGAMVTAGFIIASSLGYSARDIVAFAILYLVGFLTTTVLCVLIFIRDVTQGDPAAEYKTMVIGVLYCLALLGTLFIVSAV